MVRDHAYKSEHMRHYCYAISRNDQFKVPIYPQMGFQGSLDVDASRIRHLAINHHLKIDFAFAGQCSRQLHIDLINPPERPLRSDVKRWNIHTTDHHLRGRFRTAEPPASAEDRQEHPIAVGTE